MVQTAQLATGADAAEDGTITAAACWLGGISDDEVDSLLRKRGEAVANLARLRACSWLAGLVSGTTEVDAGGCSVSLSAAVDTPLIDQTLKFPWRDTWCTSSSAIAEKPRCSVGQFWVAITPYSADRPISIKSNQIEIID